MPLGLTAAADFNPVPQRRETGEPITAINTSGIQAHHIGGENFGIQLAQALLAAVALMAADRGRSAAGIELAELAAGWVANCLFCFWSSSWLALRWRCPG